MSSYENPSPPASLSDGEALRECNEFISLSEHPAWPKVVIMLEGLVSEALTDMKTNLSSDDALRSRLMWRWQQRDAMTAYVLDYVASFHNLKQKLIEEMEHERDDSEPSGYTSFPSGD